MKKISFLAIFLLTASVLFAQVVENKQVKAHKGPKVLMETTMGPIMLQLYDETPIHRDNFIKLVESGEYNELLFQL